MKESESKVVTNLLEFEKFWNSIESGRWNLNIQEYNIILILLYTFKESGNEVQLKNIEDLNAFLEAFWQKRGKEYEEIFLPFMPIIERTSETAITSFWNVFSDFTNLIRTKNFQELFDFLIFRITKIQGKFSGEYLQPNELTNFILEFMEIKEKFKIYNPFGGLASFGVFLNSSVYYKGQEINPIYCAIGKLRLLSHENKINHDLDNEDSIKNWNPEKEKFDLILTFPPLGFETISSQSNNPYSSLYEFIIQNSLKSLNPEGKLGLIISNNTLSSEGSLKKLREKLIVSDLVETVINFPANLLFHTGIPFSFIILAKKKKSIEKIRFIDATDFVYSEKGNSSILDYKSLINYLKIESDFRTNDFYVSNELIKKQVSNLSISRYQWLETFSGNPLSEFISILKEELFYPTEEGKLVSIKDLKDDVLDYSLDVSKLELKAVKPSFRRITKSALLLSIRGNNMKPTWFEYQDQPLFLSPDIQAFAIEEKKINVEYLIYKLYSKNVKDQHKLLSKGTSIPYLSPKDILEFKIEVSSIEEQNLELKELREKAIENRLISSGLQNEILKIKKDQREDLSIKKHNIMQHMNNVKESARRLYKLLIENNGVLNSDTLINPSTNMTVKKRFETMMESIDDSLYYIDNITNEVNYGREEILEIFEYFPEVMSKGVQSNDYFEINHMWDLGNFIHEIVGDREKFLNEAICDEIILYNGYIKISKNSFQEIYNNIIENAILHGFTDKNRKYRIEISISCSEDSSSVCFSFRNNGNPFPKGMAERYCLKGEKAGKFGNKGIGSWKVCDIVNHFGGKVIVHDLQEDEFPVKIDIILPIPYNEPES